MDKVQMKNARGDTLGVDPALQKNYEAQGWTVVEEAAAPQTDGGESPQPQGDGTGTVTVTEPGDGGEQKTEDPPSGEGAPSDSSTSSDIPPGDAPSAARADAAADASSH